MHQKRLGTTELKHIYKLEVNKFMYKHCILILGYQQRLSIILNSLQMFIRTIQDISKPDKLFYQKHVQTQGLE